MYTANVYKVFIASPTDVADERDSILKILNDWNVINGEEKNKILQTMRWEQDTYPSMAHASQENINKQILETSDLVIGIFWTRIGTPTKEYESGSVEEIKKHISNGKPAMLYFSNTPVSPHEIEPDQYQKLTLFKEWCKNHSLFEEYNSIDDFKEKLSRQLSLLINKDLYFSEVIPSDQPKPTKIIRAKNSRSDIIDFLSNLKKFRSNYDALEEFYESLGQYRFSKINPVLEELEIMKVLSSGNGKPFLQLNPRFYTLEDRDIEQIKEDIDSGEYNYIL
ncbi:MAG: DUF4062 domain-containing protein [Spirochaetales bacterium]|nr:DUF4062 domain-containing protein [Spirochaetales bacterium]